MKLLEVIDPLYEMYDYNGAEKYSGIDRDLYNYIRNERSLHWSDDEITQARDVYGNVPTGPIYRGMKINNEELLHKLEKIQKSGKGTIKLDLESAADTYSEALSFAMYVKSYDELTMLRSLSDSMKRGSAGQYGTAVLTLEPKPDQVIVKTYSSGNEQEYNSNYHTPPYALESEVILKGDIRVVGVEIFYPLTKENWKDVLRKQLRTINDLDHDFTISWLKENISQDQIDEFGKDILPKITKTNDDVLLLIEGNNLFSKDIVYDLPIVDQFIKDHLDTRTSHVVYNGKSINVASTILRRYLHKVTGLPAYFKELLDNFDASTLKTTHGFSVSDTLQNIIRITRLHPELARKMANHSQMKKINEFVHNTVKSILMVDEHDFKNQQDGQEFLNQLNSCITVLEFLKVSDTKALVLSLIQHIFHGIATRGPVTDSKKIAMWVAQQASQNYVGRLMNIIK